VVVPQFFQVHAVQSVRVIELTLPESIDAVDFDRLNEAVLPLIKDKAAEPWVLDLAAVACLGSAMLGLIVNIRQQIKSAGGKLVLCGMSPKLAEIFRTSSMDRLFTIARSRHEAIEVHRKTS